MEFKSFNAFFPEQAKNETRSIILKRPLSGLEKGVYTFFELYCTDVTCDCRRAMIRVCDESGELRATLSYGWEDRRFYADWMGDDECIDDMPGVNLYSLQPQGKDYLKLLDVFNSIIQNDPSYAERLQQHYFQVKEKLKGIDQVKKPNKHPVSIRTGKKIGRNDPCHCGSGKKAKKCCLNTISQ